MGHPPKARGAFVASVGDARETHATPRDPERPVARVDAGGKQLTGDVREPPPARVGSAAERAGESVRGGMANLFGAVEPPAGGRHAQVTERRTGADFARPLRALSDEPDPGADRIVIVCGSLSTHAGAALYEAFDAAEARRLATRFAWQYTPRHGPWVPLAECERSALAGQCPDRRPPDLDPLRRGVAAWESARNAAEVTIDWPFTTADARVKLKRLYPKTQPQ
jgi:hypothetical protein